MEDSKRPEKDKLDKFLDKYNDQQHDLSGWISEYRAARREVERLKQRIDSFNNAISIVEDYKPSEGSGNSWSDGYLTAKNDILEKLREAQN